MYDHHTHLIPFMHRNALVLAFVREKRTKKKKTPSYWKDQCQVNCSGLRSYPHFSPIRLCCQCMALNVKKLTILDWILVTLQKRDQDVIVQVLAGSSQSVGGSINIYPGGRCRISKPASRIPWLNKELVKGAISGWSQTKGKKMMSQGN